VADLFKIYKICPRCSGDGEIDSTLVTPEPDDPETAVTRITCPICNGVKEVEWGRMEEVA
jgi:hypothetical protein